MRKPPGRFAGLIPSINGDQAVVVDNMQIRTAGCLIKYPAWLAGRETPHAQFAKESQSLNSFKRFDWLSKPER